MVPAGTAWRHPRAVPSSPALAVNSVNLNDAPLILLLRRLQAESKEEMFARLQKDYDARLDDPAWGQKFQLGPDFAYRGQRFTQVQTFAGSLVVRIVFDIRRNVLDRAAIFRFDSEDALHLLAPDDSEIQVDDRELIRTDR